MTRRIDHLVLAVRDLDRAAQFYDRLGLKVGARNRHPWGTENRLVQFATSFLELISLAPGADVPPHAPGQFSFGAFLRDYLARREGLAMLVLDTGDARADAARFAAAGIGDFAPFFFERKGRRPDGSETHVAFTLAFAADPALPEAGFFTCEQHFPEAFWNPALQDHPCGAADVAEVVLSLTAPARHAGFVSAFAGSPVGPGLDCPLGAGGRLRLAATGGPQGFSAYALRLPDLGAQRARLRAAGIAFADAPDRLDLPAGLCHGVGLGFLGA